MLTKHAWEVHDPVRFCTTCGRREIEQFEQTEFADGVEWECFEPGDLSKHWPRLVREV